MSVQLLPDGRIYHTSINPDGSTREHFHDGSIREAENCYVLDCVECDSITQIPKHESNADFRNIEEMKKNGFARIKVAPKDQSKWDAFAFAKEDGLKTVPSKIPQTTKSRIALRNKIKSSRYG